jgi:cytochrome c-type biogenesis protein CcmH
MTDAELEARFQVLGHELRCLVCQNQTLADSNADLARDLRSEVEAQIRQGKTDREIKDYLVARYGDFVLYKPEVKASTYLLWGGPFALLAGGGLAWVVSRRRRSEALGASLQKNQEQIVKSDLSTEQARKLLD